MLLSELKHNAPAWVFTLSTRSDWNLPSTELGCESEVLYDAGRTAWAFTTARKKRDRQNGTGEAVVLCMEGTQALAECPDRGVPLFESLRGGTSALMLTTPWSHAGKGPQGVHGWEVVRHFQRENEPKKLQFSLLPFLN